MRNLTAKLLVLALALFIPIHLKAQDVASITGTVTDPSGAVIPGVSVTLVNSATNATYQAETNSIGSYTISNVVPGPGYKITFTRDGFKPTSVTDLYLNVSATRTQNARLVIGGASDTVEVSASNQTVTLDTTDATVGNNFQVILLNELPVQDRSNPTALFYQQPGVTLDGSVTGARTDQSRVTVDGLDVNDMATGDFGSIAANAPVDSVQEFRAETAGLPASAGQGGGGQFQLVTRSGTNNFHGAIVEYLRNTAATANDWFLNDTGVGRPALIRNQFGGYVGGPIWRNKAFFFFDYDGRRDTQSTLVERTVPLPAYMNGTLSYENTANGVSSLSSTDVANLDPQKIGYNSSIQSLFTGRYPVANDLTGSYGDKLNTAGYRFTYPTPVHLNTYVSKLDYNLTQTMKLWGRFTIEREDATESAIQFPGDPSTAPYFNRSRAWVFGHTWTIGNNKTNDASWGQTVTDVSFPNTYNPTGQTQFTFGTDGTGGSIISNPYKSASNAQNRTYPIPVVRDDFKWQKGRHNIDIGGTFKYINPYFNTILDYDGPSIGLGGNLSGLDSDYRPSDLLADSSYQKAYDSAFLLALGRYASVSSTYNYDATGNVLPQGTGSQRNYRYYETEIYVGDTWKVNPSLTLTYGVRWQYDTVPYEKNGLQSAPSIDYETYFKDRVAQSAAGIYGDAALPFVSYNLAGKANHASPQYEPDKKNIAPRVGFAFSPSTDRKSVISGSASITYDETVVSALLYQQAQYSYLFQASNTTEYGNTTADDTVTASLLEDPRFSGLESPPPPPVAPTITKPYTPYVQDGSPYGLSQGQFNETIDKNFKTPYNIDFNLGIQHEFPAGFLFKADYVGRLGRRLMAQADAAQLIDFPDNASGQLMSDAVGNVEKELAAGVSWRNVTTQPWFEDLLANPSSTHTATQVAAYYANSTLLRGDFADSIYYLDAYGLLPANIGMTSQFAESTYYTNKGFSNYHGLLATLHKNMGSGLQFDINYTWSHSIDNVSVTANTPAIGGAGFICDALRPRSCRGNSDFDVTQYLNGNFIYELPVGRGRSYVANAPFWLNEAIGGWTVSGLPSWHTGTPYFATGDAFITGFANNAPVLFNGHTSDLKAHVHRASDGTVYAFDNVDKAYSDFSIPIGFNYGTRNNLRGPGYFNLDLGLGKTFAVYKDKVNLKFRCDAFNAFNHASFDTPSLAIDNSPAFGIISTTASTARVLQGALRLEF